MRLVLTRDIDDFAARVEGFLAQRIERNVLATVLVRVRRGSYDSVGPFAYGLDERGEVCAAALRTHPWPLLVSELDVPAAERLIEAWLPEDPAVAGVTAMPATARAIAAAWARQTGGRTHCHMRQAMHLLSEVSDPPRPAAGRLRPATAADRDSCSPGSELS